MNVVKVIIHRVHLECDLSEYTRLQKAGCLWTALIEVIKGSCANLCQCCAIV